MKTDWKRIGSLIAIIILGLIAIPWFFIDTLATVAGFYIMNGPGHSSTLSNNLQLAVFVLIDIIPFVWAVILYRKRSHVIAFAVAILGIVLIGAKLLYLIYLA